MQFVKPMLEQMQLLPRLWIGIHKFLRIPPQGSRIFLAMENNERISKLMLVLLNKIDRRQHGSACFDADLLDVGRNMLIFNCDLDVIVVFAQIAGVYLRVYQDILENCTEMLAEEFLAFGYVAIAWKIEQRSKEDTSSQLQLRSFQEKFGSNKPSHAVSDQEGWQVLSGKRQHFEHVVFYLFYGCKSSWSSRIPEAHLIDMQNLAAMLHEYFNLHQMSQAVLTVAMADHDGPDWIGGSISGMVQSGKLVIAVDIRPVDGVSFPLEFSQKLVLGYLSQHIIDKQLSEVLVMSGNNSIFHFFLLELRLKGQRW